MEKYITAMFPYPSGSGLHIGHWYNYAIVDSYCKIQKYKGDQVFQPFGFDSFGLPAENYAKKVGRNPKEVTEENIVSFENEMKRMNTSFDIKSSTHSEDYQKRTQWLFNKLKEHGLAYKAKRAQCYCPSCETVLANEQVKNTKIVSGLPDDGNCERCNTKVTVVEKEQWFFKITAYADRLLEGLKTVDYPAKTKKQQIEWIGKSEGYEIDFGNGIVVFTTKPETILDVEFIVVPLEEDGIEKQIGEAISPVGGTTIPIWTADYVVKGYGTGYVMGVPNDDKRDRDFAIRHGIEFNYDKSNISDESFIKTFAKPKTNYRLKDWCVSRQRSWGCPIPIEGETDTLDTFVDSSFYTVEYDKTRPVDVYVGGNEHACGHLIFSRFICKFLFDIGYIDFDEPFKQVIHQGMILGTDGNKMSKSKGNVINPDGYDPQLLRMYLMFINHYFDGGIWQDNGYKGCQRFRNKLVNWTGQTNTNGLTDFNRIFEAFKTKVINYFDSWKTNKVVSEWMIFYNSYNSFNLNKEQAIQVIEFFNACF